MDRHGDIIHGIFSCVMGEQTINHIFFDDLREVEKAMITMTRTEFGYSPHGFEKGLPEVCSEITSFFDKARKETSKGGGEGGEKGGEGGEGEVGLQEIVNFLNTNISDVAIPDGVEFYAISFEVVKFNVRYEHEETICDLLSQEKSFKKDYILRSEHRCSILENCECSGEGLVCLDIKKGEIECDEEIYWGTIDH